MASSGSGPAAERAEGARLRRVLVAEDVPTLRTCIARFLSDRGWEVEEVGEWRQLQRRIDAFAPAFVVLDWSLAGDGVHELVGDLRRRGIGVLVMTGDPDAVDDERLPVLGKPFRLDVLVERLEEMT